MKLRVVDGFVERVDASTIDALARPRVLAVIGALVDKRHLTQAELERKLLIAAELTGNPDFEHIGKGMPSVTYAYNFDNADVANHGDGRVSL